MRPWGVATAIAVAAAVCASVVVTALTRAHPFPDLDVYRAGAHAVRSGAGLYDVRGASGGPFTYPPIAALLLWPATLLPLSAAGAVLAAVTIAGAVLVVRLTAPTAPTPIAALVIAAALETVPMRTTVYFGQIGAVLMALVVVDLLATDPPWPRGVLIGVAAAVKLTPLLFIVYLVVVKRKRVAATALASFATLTAVGALALPSASRRYWTSALWETDRIGDISGPHNHSLWGLLQSAGAPRGVAAATCVTVAGAVLWQLRRRHVDVAAVAIVGLLSCLVAPITWSHHLVWVLPAVALIATARASATARVVAVTVVTAAFARWSASTQLLAVTECAATVATVGGYFAFASILKPSCSACCWCSSQTPIQPVPSSRTAMVVAGSSSPP